MRNPKLFLFDEPLSNLDAALRMSTRVEIARLHRELGAAMVYVTHDQTEAMTLADRIVVLRAGHVEQIGTPYELYNSPANKFVAGFLGSPAMNFLPGDMLDTQRTVTVGIRPEHLRIVDDGPIKGHVRHVERLGGDTNAVIGLAGGETIVLRLFGQAAIHTGDALSLDYDRDHALLFDEAGQRVS